MGGKPFFHFFENFLTQKQFFLRPLIAPNAPKTGRMRLTDLWVIR
jgi:hypothetical protein